MNYLFKNRKNAIKKLPRPFLVVSVFVVIIILLNFLSPHALSGTVQWIGTPFWSFGESVRDVIYSTSNFFKTKNSLISENKSLREKNTKLKMNLLNQEAIIKENKKLNEILNRDKNKNIILGYVISWPPSSPYDTLIIDVGMNQGVEKKDKVFFNDLVIGEIYDVFDHTSLVYLFSTNGSKSDVVLNEKIPVTAEGIGGGNFIIKLPKGIDVKNGDKILLPDTNVSPFGIVEYVETKPSDAFQNVFFRSPFNIFDIKEVHVLNER